MEYAEFSTPEDVGLGYELAGPPSRFGGYVIDHLFLLLMQLLFLFGLFVVDVSMWGHGSATLITFVIVLLGFSEFLYFGYFEWRWNGLTPGKKSVGMKVVMAGGQRLTAKAVLIRNLFRPIDMIPITWVVPMIDRQHRRLGDFVAGTLVMRQAPADLKDLAPILKGQKHADLVLRYLDIGGQDQGRLGHQDFLAIETYLERIKSLPRAKRESLSEMILSPILVKLKRERPDSSAVRAKVLLEEVYLALRDNPRLMD